MSIFLNFSKTEDGKKKIILPISLAGFGLWYCWPVLKIWGQKVKNKKTKQKNPLAISAKKLGKEGKELLIEMRKRIKGRKFWGDIY